MTTDPIAEKGTIYTEIKYNIGSVTSKQYMVILKIQSIHQVDTALHLETTPTVT